MYINHLLPRTKRKFDLRDLRTDQYCFLFKHPNNRILFHLFSQVKKKKRLSPAASGITGQGRTQPSTQNEHEASV